MRLHVLRRLFVPLFHAVIGGLSTQFSNWFSEPEHFYFFPPATHSGLFSNACPPHPENCHKFDDETLEHHHRASVRYGGSHPPIATSPRTWALYLQARSTSRFRPLAVPFFYFIHCQLPSIHLTTLVHPCAGPFPPGAVSNLTQSRAVACEDSTTTRELRHNERISHPASAGPDLRSKPTSAIPQSCQRGKPKCGRSHFAPPPPLLLPNWSGVIQRAGFCASETGTTSAAAAAQVLLNDRA